MTRRKQRVALAEVEAFKAHIAAFAARLLHVDDIAIACRVFLDDNGVGAVRHKAAGENPRCFADSNRRREGTPGRHFADDLQARRDIGHIAGANCITIHRRDIGRRLGAQCFQRFRQDAAIGVGEWRAFGRQYIGMRQHMIERLGYRDQCHNTHSSAR